MGVSPRPAAANELVQEVFPPRCQVRAVCYRRQFVRRQSANTSLLQTSAMGSPASQLRHAAVTGVAWALVVEPPPVIGRRALRRGYLTSDAQLVRCIYI